MSRPRPLPAALVASSSFAEVRVVVQPGELVRREAAIRNVIPLRDPAALPADAGIAADEEAIVGCEDSVGSDLLP